jgi:hypothetical protein
MQPANTGKVVKSMTAVTNMHQIYKVVAYTPVLFELFISILTKKLAEPKMEEIPAQCKDKIT